MKSSREVAKGLRELADKLDSLAELQMSGALFNDYKLTRSEEDLNEFLALIKSLGSFEKEFTDDYFKARIKFPGDITLEFFTDRVAVCTPRKVMKEVEVTEWDCSSVLDRALATQGIEPESVLP